MKIDHQRHLVKQYIFTVSYLQPPPVPHALPEGVQGGRPEEELQQAEELREGDGEAAHDGQAADSLPAVHGSTLKIEGGSLGADRVQELQTMQSMRVDQLKE